MHHYAVLGGMKTFFTRHALFSAQTRHQPLVKLH